MDNDVFAPSMNNLLLMHISTARMSERQTSRLPGGDAYGTAGSARMTLEDIEQSVHLVDHERDEKGTRVGKSLRHSPSFFGNILGSFRKRRDVEGLAHKARLLNATPVTDENDQPLSHVFCRGLIVAKSKVEDTCQGLDGKIHDSHENEVAVIFTDPFKTPPATPTTTHSPPPLSPLSVQTNSPDSCKRKKRAKLMSRMKSLQILGPEASGAIAERWAKENGDHDYQD